MKKIALIFGVTGQDGSYLSEFLLKKKYVVHGVKRRSSSLNTGRVDHIYQVGVYENLLKKCQGVSSENLYILLKDGTKQKVKLNEIYDVFNSHKEKYEQFLKSEVDKTKPEKCSFCTMCDWEEVCSKEWKEKRHINQTGGINRGNQKKRFINSGIDTIDK